ncbi:hypothetical protein P9Z55_32435, partial [Bacillus thuringiensis]|nr:hypothetical protein [Bacillus thuringiensis]
SIIFVLFLLNTIINSTKILIVSIKVKLNHRGKLKVGIVPKFIIFKVIGIKTVVNFIIKFEKIIPRRNPIVANKVY